MPKQNTPKNPDIMKFREKFLDIKQRVTKIESINNLLTAYSDEYSPEASIIASLIDNELEEIFNMLEV